MMTDVSPNANSPYKCEELPSRSLRDLVHFWIIVTARMTAERLVCPERPSRTLHQHARPMRNLCTKCPRRARLRPRLGVC